MLIRNTSILYMEIPILTLSIIINRQQDLKKISPQLEREIKTERQEVLKLRRWSGQRYTQLNIKCL